MTDCAIARPAAGRFILPCPGCGAALSAIDRSGAARCSNCGISARVRRDVTFCESLAAAAVGLAIGGAAVAAGCSVQ